LLEALVKVPPRLFDLADLGVGKLELVEVLLEPETPRPYTAGADPAGSISPMTLTTDFASQRPSARRRRISCPIKVRSTFFFPPNHEGRINQPIAIRCGGISCF